MAEDAEKLTASVITTFDALMQRSVQGDSLEWPPSIEAGNARVTALLSCRQGFRKYLETPEAIDLQLLLGVTALLAARASQTRFSGHSFPNVVWSKHLGTIMRYQAVPCRLMREELQAAGVAPAVSFADSMRKMKEMGFDKLLVEGAIWPLWPDDPQYKLLMRFQEAVSWWMTDLGFTFTPELLIPLLLSEFDELEEAWRHLEPFRDHPVYPLDIIGAEHGKRRNAFSYELADIFHYLTSIAITLDMQLGLLASRVPFRELQEATNVPMAIARLRQFERWVVLKTL